jgi:nicotinamidase/pyrazinamidase
VLSAPHMLNLLVTNHWLLVTYPYIGLPRRVPRSSSRAYVSFLWLAVLRMLAIRQEMAERSTDSRLFLATVRTGGSSGTNVIFWDVDTQKDFLIPGGRLYIRGAEKILTNLHELTVWAGAHQIPIISSACAHRPGDPELKTYGQHCMAGTPGQQKVRETLLASRFTVPNRPIELPQVKSFQQIIIEKQHFDVFTNPNTDRVLLEFPAHSLILLYGVTTDICVAHAANALIERGHRVALVADAVAALDTRKAEVFLESFQERGGTLVRAHEVLWEARAA